MNGERFLIPKHVRNIIKSREKINSTLKEFKQETKEEILDRVEKGDYDVINKFLFEGQIITYFSSQKLTEFTSNSSSNFLRNILRTSILNKYRYTGDFKGGILAKGLFSIHCEDEAFEYEELFNEEDYQIILTYSENLNRIFECIKDNNEQKYFSWLFNLIRMAEPIDIANLISTGMLYEMIEKRTEDFVKTLEKCTPSALETLISAFEYICVDEVFYELEKYYLIDRFRYVSHHFTKKLINLLNLIYLTGEPKIRENLERYEWVDVDFFIEIDKKMFGWMNSSAISSNT